MNCLKMATLLACALFLNCEFVPSYSLQRLSSRSLLPEPSCIIPSTNKSGTFTVSGAVSGSPKPTPYRFSDGSYYEVIKSEENANRNNIRLSLPSCSFSLTASLQSRLLVTGVADLRASVIDAHLLYDASLGVGVRLYRGGFAGLVVATMGIMHTYDSILVYEQLRYGDYDRWDARMQNLPTAGISATMTYSDIARRLNPFISLAVKYVFMFSYHTIGLDLFAPTLTAGVCTRPAPIRMIGGIRATYLLIPQSTHAAHTVKNLVPEAFAGVQADVRLRKWD